MLPRRLPTSEKKKKGEDIYKMSVNEMTRIRDDNRRRALRPEAVVPTRLHYALTEPEILNVIGRHMRHASEEIVDRGYYRHNADEMVLWGVATYMNQCGCLEYTRVYRQLDDEWRRDYWTKESKESRREYIKKVQELLTLEGSWIDNELNPATSDEYPPRRTRGASHQYLETTSQLGEPKRDDEAAIQLPATVQEVKAEM